jgi:transposase-like protein
MSRPKRYPEELIQRGVRIALERDRPIAHIAHDLGIGSESASVFFAKELARREIIGDRDCPIGGCVLRRALRTSSWVVLHDRDD